jgi:phosphatidylglycerophosphate synthase
MQKRAFYIVNGITLYRMIAVPVLLLFIVNDDLDIFKWLLPISFFTDAIDGFLARKYKVSSKFGSRLDSIADDLTVVVAIIGLLVFKPELLRHEIALIIVLVALYLFQTAFALIRYGKISGFHTYTAKFAAVLQGLFLITVFFVDEPLYIFFRIAAVVTAIGLVEEIILVLILPEWQNDVKGLFHVLRKKSERDQIAP